MGPGGVVWEKKTECPPCGSQAWQARHKHMGSKAGPADAATEAGARSACALSADAEVVAPTEGLGDISATNLSNNQSRIHQTIRGSCVPFLPARLAGFFYATRWHRSKLRTQIEARINIVIHALIVDLEKYTQKRGYQMAPHRVKNLARLSL